jgi:hypothetical protein
MLAEQNLSDFEIVLIDDAMMFDILRNLKTIFKYPKSKK